MYGRVAVNCTDRALLVVDRPHGAAGALAEPLRHRVGLVR